VSIVGLWNITFLYGGQAFDYGFDLWHADGTELLNDVTNPIEGNVCVGVWEKTGARTYKLKHVTWNFDLTGALIGSGVFDERVKLNAEGNSYTGTIVLTFYDLSGDQVGEFSGTVEATRITPDWRPFAFAITVSADMGCGESLFAPSTSNWQSRRRKYGGVLWMLRSGNHI
jgi:hypothetical protein